MNKLTFGKRLKNIIELSGLSQSKVARLANISTDYMNRLANDKVDNPTIQKVEDIAKVLNVHPNQLLYGEEIDKSFEWFGPAYEIPLLTGAISAGDFEDALGGNWEGDTMPFHEDPKDKIAWKVKGRSMEPAIKDGDLIYIHKGRKVMDGCYVVAKNGNNELTVKQVKYLENGDIELRPLNPDFGTLRFKADDIIHFFGVVIGRYEELVKRSRK